MDKIVGLLMNSISASVFDAECDVAAFKSASGEEIKSLYALAKHHDVSHIVAHTLDKFKIAVADEEVAAELKKQMFTAVFRSKNRDHELSRITRALEEAEIPFMPLKGAVISKLYSVPWLRTSCDIDILINENDLEKADTALVEIGYVYKEKSPHDISYFSKSGVHLELHFSLFDSVHRDGIGLPMDGVWERATPVLGAKYCYTMDSDDFYYYHVAHMAKHYINGGCGVRPYIDLELIKKHYPKSTGCCEMLSLGGLSAFSEASDALSSVWFSGAEHTELTLEMEEYLLNAGVYGAIENAIVVSQVRRGGRFSHLMSRIWLPYERLAEYYPSLDGKRWLTPLYQVRRWFKIAFCGGFKRATNEMKLNATLSEEKRHKIEKLLEELGLS